MDVRDAECLSASWKNPGAFKKSTYRVRNMCPLYGEVAAKIDLVGARDRTVNLDNGRARRGWAWRHIRSISCCSDTGICNRSDAVTDEACLARFKRVSTAPLSCRDISASANPSGGKLSCNVSAFCTFSPPPSTRYQLSTITVPFIALGNVHNCRGTLSAGPCDDDPPDTARVWVFDADAREVGRPSLDFRVYLSRILRETVRIDYATSDGTATAGSDYRATSGTLTFRPGETAKTVSVPVFDDGHDEGDERLTLTLSNPRPSSRVRLDDATAEGVIANADPVPRAWIGRFGRTVADQVLDAVDARMRAKPAPGVEARLAGQRIGAETAFPNPVARPHPPVGGDPVAGTSFSLTGETRHDGLLSIWGRGAVTRLAGRDAAGAGEGGDVAVDGEVATGLLGADWTRGRWTTGLVVTHSRGDGGYRGAGVGATASTLTGVWPWTRYALGERLSLWGAAGYGDGSLTLEPRAEDGTRARANRTDLDLWMASAGLRGVAVDGGDDGLTLAVKTDAMTVRTASDAVTGAGGNLAAAKAQVTRFRLGLEGSRPIRMADGSALTPSVEIGLRHDGGDAETGFGLDIGGGLAWSDTASGIAAEFRGRGLLIHEADGFRERGLSGSLSWDPPPASDRGPSASLTQTLGGHTSGGTIALLSRETLAGVAADDNGNDLSQRRLEARFGYGFPAFGARFTSAPEIALGLSNTGRDYSLGWRLARGGGSLGHGSLELSVQARRRENGYDRNVPLEHSVAFRAMSRF
ncbi:MAG: hypothetical protein OXI64_02265 [Defluviicoccus sp.]|nr:hypothetical protein [Defluviicoccus sp.]